MKTCEFGMSERANTCASCQLTAIQLQLFISIVTDLSLCQAATMVYGKPKTVILLI